jgi:molecular chaperone DnaK (HSP70)
MAEAIGLSIGATRFAGVQLGRTAVTRHSVLTLYHQRQPELGVPGENPNLVSPGLVVTGFVERVGDPVGMVAGDGSVHRAELLVADALRELLYSVTSGRPPVKPALVTHPAHWPRAAVDALRSALTHVPGWSGAGQPITLLSDAAAAISALQSDPGVPARGVIALCDFGGTGTSITLVNASRGYAPLGPTVRHTEFCGDLID